MTRRALPGLAALLLVVACQNTGSPTTSASSKPPQPLAASSKPVASATPAATASSAALPTAAPVQPQVGTLLLKPSTPTHVLVGRVQLDASYVVSAGGGNLLSNNGGSFLAEGRVQLVGDQLKTGDGLAVAGASGNLISNNGGTIIGHNGSSVISDSGSSLTGKVKRQVLQAEAPTYGALFPAAGVEIRLRSLATGKPVPLGVDAAGVPVYAVYTNLAGSYEVYVPADEPVNVLVQANNPAKLDDPRQSYGLIAKTDQAQAVTLDEDSGLASRELREVLANVLQHYMVDDPDVTLCEIGQSANLTSEATRTLLGAALVEFHDEAVKVGVSGDPGSAEAVRALAYRLADSLLATEDLGAIMLGSAPGVKWGVEAGEVPAPALDAITEALKALREGATPKLQADPGYFDQQAYFQLANACDPGRYAIKKPADLSAFVVDEFMGNGSDPGLVYAKQVFTSVDVKDDSHGIDMRHKVNVAANTIEVALSTRLLNATDEQKAAMRKLLATFDPAHPVLPGEATPPPVRVPCPRPSVFSNASVCGPSPRKDP